MPQKANSESDPYSRMPRKERRKIGKLIIYEFRSEIDKNQDSYFNNCPIP